MNSVRFAVAGLLVAAAAAGLVPGSASPTAAVAAPQTIPVTVHGGQGTRGGARPMVEVRVGRAKPVPVLLDTGSSGLHIFKPVVDTGSAGGVTVTTRPANISYSGGSRFTGVVASAVITIGSQATAAPVPFALVERASCVATKPTCPTAGGIPAAMAKGDFGVLGIGTARSQGDVISPILGMPGALGRTWSLHMQGAGGSLVLGALLPSGPAPAARVQLARTGTSAGHALWADSRVPICLTVGTAAECTPALFDSGTFSVQISGGSLNQAPTRPGSPQVLAGTPVTMSLRGARTPFWTFTAGTTKSKDTVTVHNERGLFVNTGVQAFYDFTIVYDDVAGTLTLLRPGG